MRFLAIIIALGGLVLGASAVPAPQATTFPSIGSGTSIGNGTTTGHVNTFIDSCSSLRIWESKTDVYLMALCRADDGKQVSTTLDLNQ
jgi:hypothetical protein